MTHATYDPCRWTEQGHGSSIGRVDRTQGAPITNEDLTMPAPLDYPRILADATAAETPDPDERAARARRNERPRQRLRLPSWITEVRVTSGDGLTMPTLRDYPWPSDERA